MSGWLMFRRPKHRRAPSRTRRTLHVGAWTVPVLLMAMSLVAGVAGATTGSSGTQDAMAGGQSSTGSAPWPANPAWPSCVRNRMGIPRKGTYVGAAVGGTQNLPALEKRAGHHLDVHRTYYTAGQVDNAIATARQDVAAGRLPWISFKMPYSWADMARGRGDAWVRMLADKLARIPGPVWLAFHHEPEGDGNMQEWKRMQQHLAPIIHARTNNVAYTVIYIAWDALFGPAQYRLSRVWPGSKYVDVLGMDLYNNFGTNRDGYTNLPMLNPMKDFRLIGHFARRHGVRWAIAETGYAPRAVNRNPDWLIKEYRDLRAQGGLALTYFDSSLNSIADWTLADPRKLRAFRHILRHSHRICP